MIEGSREYFDQVSTLWDGMRSDFFAESVREAALDALGVHAGGNAADLGAGTGFITEGLLARGLGVVAVDQSAAMLAELKGKLGQEAIECRVGDAEELPLPDCSVDYVLANMYLHHVGSPPAAIAEARILRPGGGLAITDLDEHNFTFLQREHHDRWLGFNHERLREWLTEAGLEQVRIDSIGTTCQAESSAGDVQASIGIFLASGRKPARGTTS